MPAPAPPPPLPPLAPTVPPRSSLPCPPQELYAGDTAAEDVFMIIFIMLDLALGAYILGMWGGKVWLAAYIPGCGGAGSSSWLPTSLVCV